MRKYERWVLINQNNLSLQRPGIKVATALIYFSGPVIRHWVTQRDEWLQAHGNDADCWNIFKAEFLKQFTDTNEQTDSIIKLQELRMTVSMTLDKYISQFDQYLTEAGYQYMDSSLVEWFKRGLPYALVEECVKHEKPNTLEEWGNTTQKHHRV